MGAWIEICTLNDIDFGIVVAPPVGAWIEIALEFGGSGFQFEVAPPVGAWIEITFDSIDLRDCVQSLPPWERGLKYLWVRI